MVGLPPCSCAQKRVLEQIGWFKRVALHRRAECQGQFVRRSSGLSRSIQSLLGEFCQGFWWIAVQNELVVLCRGDGIVQPQQFDVPQQKCHKSPPSQSGRLRVGIAGWIAKLVEQGGSDALCIAVAPFSIGLFSILIALLEVPVHDPALD